MSIKINAITQLKKRNKCFRKTDLDSYIHIQNHTYMYLVLNNEHFSYFSVEKPLEIDTPTQQRRILPDENGVDKKPDRDLTIPLITIRKPSTPGPGGKESYPKGGVGVWVHIYPLFNLFFLIQQDFTYLKMMQTVSKLLKPLSFQGTLP